MKTTIDNQELQTRLQQFSEAAPKILRRSKLTEELAPDLERALSNSESPFTLAVTGRMKVGKSTLINAMAGADLAIPGVTETTATVNWFRYGVGDQTKQFRVVWNDSAGLSDVYDLAEKDKWLGNSELATRTRFLEFYSNAEFLKKVHVADLPGSGSTLGSHTSSVEGFLFSEGKAEHDSQYYGGMADCIAYVLPPITRETDSETLSRLTAECRLPQSTPYNSVGLLHKWESLEHPQRWLEAERQASKAFEFLKSYVCSVIPVSGPLGRACQLCPSEFWEDIVEFSRGTSSDAFEILTISEPRFIREESGCALSAEKRGNLFATSQLPWQCFKTILLIANSKSFESGQDLYIAVRKIAGIDRLLQFMDERFFERSRLIRTSNVLHRALRVTEIARGKIRNRLEDLNSDQKLGREALTELESATQLKKSREFIEHRVTELQAEAINLSQDLRDLDVQSRSVRRSMELFDRESTAIQQLDEYAEQFQPDEVQEILRLLGAYGTSLADRLGVNSGDNPVDMLHDRLDYWLVVRRNTTGERRAVLNHVVGCIEELLQQAMRPDP